MSASDFHQPELYVRPDWRYQAFFEYLRISPSYTLALSSERQDELTVALGDAERAGLVWRTKQDMGDVHATIYKIWLQEQGLAAFGIHSQRPSVTPLVHMHPERSDVYLRKRTDVVLEKFLAERYQKQGRPDSVLFSIPLNQKTSITIRQLKKALANVKAKVTPVVPVTKYSIIQNKMRMTRLRAGYALVLHRAARPEDELWRVATRAKISKEHSGLDPKSPKKSKADAQARRMLTIMASRLYHDSLIIAENAAIGKFPSLDPIDILAFDLKEKGLMMRETFKREREIIAKIKLEAEQNKQEQGSSETTSS